jgi:hypothetical protein
MTSLEYAMKVLNNEYKHVLEFGVYKGHTITKIKDTLSHEYKIFGFDSFEGLPEDWTGTVCNKGFFTTNGNIPDINGVTFYKGWFEDTIKEYLKVADNISLLHVDCDLYSSTKTIFDNLHPFIKQKTLIVFDEWIYNGNSNCNDHEQKAFYEYVEKNKINFRFIDFIDETPCGVERKIVEIL